MKYIKKVVAIALLFSLCIVSIPFVSTAKTSGEHQSYSSARISTIVRNCPNCKHSNTSYGCDPMFTGGSYKFFEGETCIYCYKTVPEKEGHICTYWKDKYFFICSSCRTSYTVYGDPYITEHQIQHYN